MGSHPMIVAYWAIGIFSISFLAALFIGACLDHDDDWEADQ